MKYILPWGLIFSRVLSAPLVIYLARLPDAWVGPVVVAIIWFALIGDILDGIIARYFGIATALMRRADSIADLIFWLGVGTAIWLWRRGGADCGHLICLPSNGTQHAAWSTPGCAGSDRIWFDVGGHRDPIVLSGARTKRSKTNYVRD